MRRQEQVRVGLGVVYLVARHDAVFSLSTPRLTRFALAVSIRPLVAMAHGRSRRLSASSSSTAPGSGTISGRKCYETRCVTSAQPLDGRVVNRRFRFAQQLVRE